MTLGLMNSQLLLVEDDEENGASLVNGLNGKCDTATVVWVRTAEAAIELLKREKFKAALIDVSLPGISGLELLEWIRSTAETKTLPILVLTHAHSTLVEKVAFASGANAYMLKPADYTELAYYINHSILMAV